MRHGTITIELTDDGEFIVRIFDDSTGESLEVIKTPEALAQHIARYYCPFSDIRVKVFRFKDKYREADR
jgi:hypothetical protein